MTCSPFVERKCVINAIMNCLRWILILISIRWIIDLLIFVNEIYHDKKNNNKIFIEIKRYIISQKNWNKFQHLWLVTLILRFEFSEFSLTRSRIIQSDDWKEIISIIRIIWELLEQSIPHLDTSSSPVHKYPVSITRHAENCIWQ